MANFHKPHFLSGCFEFSFEKLFILICNVFIVIVQDMQIIANEPLFESKKISVKEAKVNHIICQLN